MPSLVGSEMCIRDRKGGGRRVRGSDARSTRTRASGRACVADSVDGWHEDARTLSGGTVADDRAPRSRRTAPACARPRRRTPSRAAWRARARDCVARERNVKKKQDVYLRRRAHAVFLVTYNGDDLSLGTTLWRKPVGACVPRGAFSPDAQTRRRAHAWTASRSSRRLPSRAHPLDTTTACSLEEVDVVRQALSLVVNELLVGFLERAERGGGEVDAS